MEPVKHKNEIKAKSFDEKKYRNRLRFFERGYALIDLDALVENVKVMRSLLEPKTGMIAVIKTDAYGHGAVMTAKELELVSDVTGYAVATFEEGAELRKSGIKKPVLILGYTFPYCYEEIAELDLTPAVFTTDAVRGLSEAAKRLRKTIKVHIKVDTGMGRIGISPDDEGLKFIKELLETENIKAEGIFTHFARADERDKESAYGQLESFMDFVRRAEENFGICFEVKHCSNSAGIFEIPKAQLTAVRGGITLYGMRPSDECEKGMDKLCAVMSLRSHISFVKEVKKGQSISYGATFTADRDMTVATIPIGYGDGYPRQLSNKGSVLIRGVRCRILGRVCMDQFMVDVSALDGNDKSARAKVGEEVVLIGRQGDEVISAEEIGEKSGRFNYELACLISGRIPRVYLRNGEIL